MTRRIEYPKLALASASNWPADGSVTTPMSAEQLQEAIAMLSAMPDESGTQDGVIAMPVCSRCHLPYNIRGHETECDGVRPESLRHCLVCWPWKHKPGRGYNDDRLVRR